MVIWGPGLMSDSTIFYPHWLQIFQWASACGTWWFIHFTQKIAWDSLSEVTQKRSCAKDDVRTWTWLCLEARLVEFLTSMVGFKLLEWWFFTVQTCGLSCKCSLKPFGLQDNCYVHQKTPRCRSIQNTQSSAKELLHYHLPSLGHDGFYHKLQTDQ